MPAPFVTAADLIEQAHQHHTNPYEYTLATAEAHGWTPAHTVEALHAVRRTLDNLPKPYPTTHPAIALANAFSDDLDRANQPRDLDLTESVASYITTLAAYQQSGDPSEAQALEALEQHLAHLVGLDLDDEPDDDRDHPGARLTYPDPDAIRPPANERIY